MAAQVDPERRAGAVVRLSVLREAGHLSSAHVRLAAVGLGVSERTVRRWLAPGAPTEARRSGVAAYQLCEADREAFVYFHGNIAAVHRARSAAVAGADLAAGLPIPQFLADGWRTASAVSERTLERAFQAGMSPAELALWREGEEGFRAAQVYLTRPRAPRGRCGRWTTRTCRSWSCRRVVQR